MTDRRITGSSTRNIFLIFLFPFTLLFESFKVNAQINFAPAQLNPFSLVNINIGTTFSSIPIFIDLDNDGDFDLLGSTSNSNFFYFENIGTISSPSFGTIQTNPFSLQAGESGYLTASDLDNDGDLDLMIGSMSGSPDMQYLENIGTASTPLFGAIQTNPFSLTSVIPCAVFNGLQISFVDLDSDGDFDLMFGECGVQYFENVGTISSPSFSSAQFNPFSFSTGGANMAFIDLDSDNILDAMGISFSGESFLYFKNTGTISTPLFSSPQQVNPFSLISDINRFSIPSFADLDNDGDLDFIVGMDNGDFNYHENTSPVGIDEIGLRNITVYPNPTKDILTINLPLLDKNAIITIHNSLGQEIIKRALTVNNSIIDIKKYDQGIYFMEIKNGTEIITKKIIKQ